MTYTTILSYDPEKHVYSVVRVETSQEDGFYEEMSREFDEIIRKLQKE